MADNLYEQIIKNIEIEISDNFEKTFKKLEKKVIKEVGKIIEKNIKNNPKYLRFIDKNETVYHQIGIPDIKRRIDNIIKLIISELKFEYKLPRGRATNVSFKLTILDLDFNKLLESEAATFVTEKGYELDWLRWLLLHGDSPVILNFRYKPVKTGSRTGLGIMVPKGNWSVPPTVSGVVDDNWITQTIYDVDAEITTLIESSIADAFN